MEFADDSTEKGQPTKSITQNYTKFAKNVSAHGFNYTVGGPFPRRVVASLTVVLFISVACYTIHGAFTDFYNGPGFNSEYKLVYTPSSQPQPLAVFAICDISPWDFGKAERAGISAQVVSYLSFFIFPYQGSHEIFSNETKSKQKLDEMESEYGVLAEKYGSVTGLLNAVTRSCEDTVFYCRLGLGRDLDGRQCCDENFSEAVYTTEGKCYSTAGKMAYKQAHAVKPSGMIIGLALAPEAEVSQKFDVTTGAFQATMFRGLTLIMTGQSDHIATAATKRSYLTMPNTMNSVALSKTVIDSSSLEQCAKSDDPEVILRHSHGFSHYTRDNCQFYGLQSAAIATMKCALMWLPNPDNVPECSPFQVTRLFQLLFKENGENAEGSTVGSTASCPLDCIHEEFSARMTSQQITQNLKALRAFQATLSNDTKEEEDNTDIVGFQIHYPSFDFIQTVQYPTVRNFIVDNIHCLNLICF